MKKTGLFVLSILLSFIMFGNQAHACTTFCLKNKGEVLFGKNYDWMIGDGLIFVNKRGVSKVALSETPKNPARWTSRYGSVTFNQYGRENPSGGMNEAGLVIELMWLDDTQYPGTDERPTVGTLEWIQYQLDTSATVSEVAKNAETVRIASEIKLHYLVNDRAGSTATIEFLNGKLVVHTGETLGAAALANDTYERSAKYAKAVATPTGEMSLDRFSRAAERTRAFYAKPRTGQEAIDYAFETLENVAQSGSTQWSIVYDQARRVIRFRSRQQRSIKTIDTSKLDYRCESPVRYFDINAAGTGDVTPRFLDYTNHANRDLIERSFNGTPFLRSVPADLKDQAAGYPETFGCGTVKPTADPPKPPTTSAGYLARAFYFLIRTLSVTSAGAASISI